MTVLAIDITTAEGSLALARDGVLLEEFSLNAPGGYGEIIFATIDSLLKRNAVELSEVDLFAAAAGPGTFTGVRMGLTVVQGLAEAFGKLVCGISNLEALAYLGSGPRRGPVLDARRGEHYTAVYSSEGGLLEAERVQTLEEFRSQWPGEPLQQSGPLAAAVAAIAVIREAQDPAAIEANYVRRSDAELNLTLRPPSLPRT